MSIHNFEYRYAFLSNRYPITVEIDGHRYKSAESAYWGMVYPEDADRIAEMTANEALCYGKGRTTDLSDDDRVAKMERVLREKFKNQRLMELLVGTAPQRLVNLTRSDTFWGVVDELRTERSGAGIWFKGKNHLGKLLRKIRDEHLKGKKNG